MGNLSDKKIEKKEDRIQGRLFYWWERNKILIAAIFIAVMLFGFKLYGDSI